jgi:hypothetical protein
LSPNESTLGRNEKTENKISGWYLQKGGEKTKPTNAGENFLQESNFEWGGGRGEQIRVGGRGVQKKGATGLGRGGGSEQVILYRCFQTSVAEPEPEPEPEPPEPYNFDPRRTGTGTVSLL